MTSQRIILGAITELVQLNRASPADRLPPWSWSALSQQHAEILDSAVDEFIVHYNAVYAAIEAELVPPCWRSHPQLAEELPVQLWSWYAVHADPAATTVTALEYHNRHLPAFQARLTTRLLGDVASRCRKGDHPDDPRNPNVLDRISSWVQPDPLPLPALLQQRTARAFGFPRET